MSNDEVVIHADPISAGMAEARALLVAADSIKDDKIRKQMLSIADSWERSTFSAVFKDETKPSTKG